MSLPTIRPAPAPYTGGEMYANDRYVGRFYKLNGTWAVRTVAQFVRSPPIHTTHRTRAEAIGALVDACDPEPRLQDGGEQ